MSAKLPKLSGKGYDYCKHFTKPKYVKEGHNSIGGFFSGFGQGIMGMGNMMVNAKIADALKDKKAKFGELFGIFKK
jgi:hypothetical protein